MSLPTSRRLLAVLPARRAPLPVFLAALFAALPAACGQGGQGGQGGQDARAGSAVACALAGAADFPPDCTMEIVAREGRRTMIVRHPDGGFRRFELGVPGRGIITADGMEEAVVSHVEGGVELSVGPDRYRLMLAP